MNSIKPLVPHQAIHPGIHLKEALLQKGIKQNEIAAEAGIQPSQLNEILKGKRPITPDLAVLFGAALNIEATYFNNLQADYNLALAQIETSVKEKVEAIKDWQLIKSLIPVSYFRKQGVLSGNLVEDVPNILSVLGFESPVHMQQELPNSTLDAIHFKKSGKLSEYTSYVNSWVRYVKHLSSSKKVEKFDFSTQKELLTEIKSLLPERNVLEKLDKVLSKHGIKLIICEKPDHAPLDGAAFWHENNPILGLTLRFQRYDNLIFSVYHELGHIFLHLKQNKEFSFVDSLEDSKGSIPQKEEEANEFAREAIIPGELWKVFTFGRSNFSDKEILLFAKTHGIPGPSVWGRLCFEGRLRYSTPSVFHKHNQIP